MDVYSLTRKKRPSHLTLGQSSRAESDNDSGLDVSVSSTKPKMDSNSSFTFDQVTGSPTREHWKRDSDSTACEYIGCLTKFGLFERRHHCRKCGDIFCSLHCSNYFRLDQYAQFHPKGLLSRGCDKCALDYIQWQEQVRRGGDTKRQPADKPAAKKRQDSNIMTPKPQAMEGVTELGRDDIVAPQKSMQSSKGVTISIKKDNQGAFNPIPSVPADWQWSTF
ncbi:hypothetical protein V8B55DRAFT_1472930 [Mucor lusitanicus]|uniref:FYVE-type domain-containing protein n=1 Tax=Mucor lusitanicus CBS 277.49 TaxID=747725 RepID=A0A168PCQ9_MUCCL|nr:hypothetical protein MUCCIDRAFT_154698 [Mucor lusitanicus CBS 277.49]